MLDYNNHNTFCYNIDNLIDNLYDVYYTYCAF